MVTEVCLLGDFRFKSGERVLVKKVDVLFARTAIGKKGLKTGLSVLAHD